MKKKYKKISAFLLASALLLNLNLTAFAADAKLVFTGKSAEFDVVTDSKYTTTDLFDNFKDVMPGDKLSETIELTNEAKDCDYIKVYMRAVIHDEEKNPLTYSESFENTDGKDQADVDGKRDETVATMKDFLSKLTMRIYDGDELIYNASPDEAGALVDNVLLGTLRRGKTLEIKVELDVPAELGNKYANRVGEVDWVFKAEGLNDPDDDPYNDPDPDRDPNHDPERGTISPDEPGELMQPEPEVDYPELVPNVPKTGDDTVVWPYVLLLGIGVVGMILTVFKKRRKENK